MLGFAKLRKTFISALLFANGSDVYFFDSWWHQMLGQMSILDRVNFWCVNITKSAKDKAEALHATNPALLGLPD